MTLETAAASAEPSASTDAAPASAAWHDVYGDDGRKVIEAKGWKSHADVLNSYRELERAFHGGVKRFTVPTQDTKDEEWGAIYDALGRPKDVAGYNVAAPKDLPKDFPYSADKVGALLNEAHAAGLNARQVEKLHGFIVRQNVEAWQSMQREREDAVKGEFDGLRKEWGKDFDTRSGRASAAAKMFAGEHADEVSGNPALMRMFDRIADAIRDDPGLKAQVAGSASALQTAREQSSGLMADSKFRDDLFGNNGSEAQRIAQRKWDEVNNRIAEEEMRAGNR